MVRQIAVLEEQVRAGFGRHPDVEIYLSQPGLGMVVGARLLAEFGDDPDRYTTAERGRTTPAWPRHPIFPGRNGW